MAAETEVVDPSRLREFVARVFQTIGLCAPAAEQVATVLVDADLSGIPSHGVALVPMYIKRLQAGSVTTAERAQVVADQGSTVVLDAANMLGQLSSAQAVEILGKRAPAHGLACVAVRNAFHFGAAGFWARALAECGLVGMALSNTRPLMPAPGGSERVVGNNPIAIAVPAEAGAPLVVDMALSASAMGKIRLAADAGCKLPEGWAANAQGHPTRDAQQAIAGMLLPAAGPKGFALAVLVDLLCGGLSGGAMGGEVRPLYGDPAVPYGCAHFFLAIDVRRFVPLDEFAGRALNYAEHIRQAQRAPGVAQLFSPGERARTNRQRNAGACPVAAQTLSHLRDVASAIGLNAGAIFSFT